jgi:hypothetical protein
MLQLLDPFTGQLEIFVGSLLGFLDEGMNDDNAFAKEEAIESAPDA